MPLFESLRRINEINGDCSHTANVVVVQPYLAEISVFPLAPPSVVARTPEESWHDYLQSQRTNLLYNLRLTPTRAYITQALYMLTEQCRVAYPRTALCWLYLADCIMEPVCTAFPDAASVYESTLSTGLRHLQPTEYDTYLSIFNGKSVAMKLFMTHLQQVFQTHPAQRAVVCSTLLKLAPADEETFDALTAVVAQLRLQTSDNADLAVLVARHCAVYAPVVPVVHYADWTLWHKHMLTLAEVRCEIDLASIRCFLASIAYVTQEVGNKYRRGFYMLHGLLAAYGVDVSEFDVAARSCNTDHLMMLRQVFADVKISNLNPVASAWLMALIIEVVRNKVATEHDMSCAEGILNYMLNLGRAELHKLEQYAVFERELKSWMEVAKLGAETRESMLAMLK